MDFALNEYVMYGAAGICRFEGVVKRCFDGKTEHEYLTLVPVDIKKSVYYVPKKVMKTKVRKLLTKDEVFSLIDSIPEIEPCFVPERNERKVLFSNVLKSDDIEQIMALLKTLYMNQEKKVKSGKQLSAMEDTAMKTAENIIFQEFALVLDIEPDSVKNFIATRIERLS